MTVTADTIRCRNDRQLYHDLLGRPAVRRINEELTARLDEGPTGIRRRLLATSVRLSRNMSPALHAMADECIDHLGVTIPLELFVYAGPQFNAACFKPEQDRLYVMFSSSLLEAFSDSELRFVLGHELGHHVYRHHDIPIGYLLRGRQAPSPRLALDLFAWSRYAEISADRAGAHCADDFDSVARALFRLASGLRGDTIRFDLADFLRQLDDMQVADAQPGQGAPREDWFSTHPFSPLRVKALELFYGSTLARPDGTPIDELEVGVQELMNLMEPAYLEGRTDDAETMRRLLFAGAVAVARADGEIQEAEIAAFEEFFGEGSLSSALDIDRLIEELPDRIERTVTKVSPSRRMQVLRDLCLIARSDGHTALRERQVLIDMADRLKVSRDFVTQQLGAELDPD
jgi:tellurite resistance protein